MGRKIPGKKHKGVKDPTIQRLKRFESIKTKINAPPKDPNEQHIPKSLSKIMELTQKIKDGTISSKYKKKKKKNKQHISSAPKNVKNTVKRLIKRNEKPIPVFTQKPGENDYRFMNRVRMKVDDFIKEQVFEEKYGVDVKRNIVTGEVTDIVKKTKQKMVDPLKTQNKEINRKNGHSENKVPHLTKNQKRQQKIKLKKLKVDLQNVDEFKEYKDEIKFGEVVHAPPTLINPKKSISSRKFQKPGQKDLLLKSFINQISTNSKITTEMSTENSSKKKKQLNNKQIINKQGKRKKLPTTTRQQLEIHQKNTIEAYKEMKSRRVNKIEI